MVIDLTFCIPLTPWVGHHGVIIYLKYAILTIVSYPYNLLFADIFNRSVHSTMLKNQPVVQLINRVSRALKMENSGCQVSFIIYKDHKIYHLINQVSATSNLCMCETFTISQRSYYNYVCVILEGPVHFTLRK